MIIEFKGSSFVSYMKVRKISIRKESVTFYLKNGRKIVK